ncbi:carbohydrate kinase family protein [Streptomyces sp. URMC 126]|uniref:carbohydrate kinase family protein n=1 Tax=Streptomyces sp. URMC 126 TaxID=3423401 RepID=UPI003F1DBF44
MSDAHEAPTAPEEGGPLHDVLVVGGAGVDTVVRVPSLPPPARDSVAVPPIHDYAGHTGTGVALGCHALGLATRFVDFVGDDPYGALVRSRLAGAGLAFTPVVTAAGTRRSVNLVDDTGARLSLYDARHPDTLRLPREVYLPLLRRSRHVHLSIMDFARHLYDDLEASGRTVSTDLHDWDGDNPHHVEFALRSDVVFLSAANVRGRLAEVMTSTVARGRASVVVATAGADGCHLLTRGERAPRHFPAVRPGGPVLDASGAGDAFAAAFLFGRLADRPVEECVRYGLVAGAHACLSPGTHGSFLDAAALRRRAEGTEETGEM